MHAAGRTSGRLAPDRLPELSASSLSSSTTTLSGGSYPATRQSPVHAAMISGARLHCDVAFKLLLAADQVDVLNGSAQAASDALSQHRVSTQGACSRSSMGRSAGWQSH